MVSFGDNGAEIQKLMAEELQLEVPDISWYASRDRLGSSTMPHKVNPTGTQHMIGKATSLRYLSSEIQELMLVDHERNMQYSIEEQKVLEEICLCVAEVLDRGEELLSTLVVNEDNMLLNINRLGGLTQSEHVMFELGKKIGKQIIHELLDPFQYIGIQGV